MITEINNTRIIYLQAHVDEHNKHQGILIRFLIFFLDVNH
jgi:hypothetical protein